MTRAVLGALRRVHRESRRIDLIILAVGFAYQMLYRFVTYHLGYDDVIQIACGLAFARTGRLGMLTAGLSDLAALHTGLVVWWPPGYSVLIAGLFKLTQDAYVAAVIVEMIGLAGLGIAIGFLIHRLTPVLSFRARLLIACVSGWWGPPVLLSYDTNV